MRLLKKVHLVVSISDLVRKTACPGLDLVELMTFLVVPCFADVDLNIRRQTARTTFEVTRGEHDEAPAFNLVNRVIAIPTGLHYLIRKKVFVEPVDSLFRPVIPAYVDHRLATRLAISTIDLCDNGFGEIVGVP